MTSRAVARADALPAEVAGSRSPIWWGMILLIVIDATVFASLYSSYFYLWAGAAGWPPGGIAPPALLLPTINSAILLASALSVHWGYRGVQRGDSRRLMLGLALGLALVTLFLALIAVEYGGKDYTWTTNVYGSLVWTIGGLQAAHAATLLPTGAMVIVLAWRGHFTDQRYEGVESAALWWYFVAGIWVPTYAVLYLAPYLLR